MVHYVVLPPYFETCNLPPIWIKESNPYMMPTKQSSMGSPCIYSRHGAEMRRCRRLPRRASPLRPLPSSPSRRALSPTPFKMLQQIISQISVLEFKYRVIHQLCDYFLLIQIWDFHHCCRAAMPILPDFHLSPVS